MPLPFFNWTHAAASQGGLWGRVLFQSLMLAVKAGGEWRSLIYDCVSERSIFISHKCFSRIWRTSLFNKLPWIVRFTIKLQISTTLNRFSYFIPSISHHLSSVLRHLFSWCTQACQLLSSFIAMCGCSFWLGQLSPAFHPLASSQSSVLAAVFLLALGFEAGACAHQALSCLWAALPALRAPSSLPSLLLT